MNVAEGCLTKIDHEDRCTCNKFTPNSRFLYKTLTFPYTHLFRTGVHILMIFPVLITKMYATEIRLRTIIIFSVAAVLTGCTVGMLTAIPNLICNILDSNQSIPRSSNKSAGVRDSLKSVRRCPSGDLLTCHSLKPRLEEDKRENLKDPKASSLHGTSVSLRYKQRLPVNKDVKREAVAALNIALDLQNQGKTEKALKVFQQAVALDPSHADILTAYGEFLEWHVKDVVKADHMYMIALEYSPEHGRALQNRQRTGPIVEEIDQARFQRVDQKLSMLYTVPNSHPGLRRAKREAYFAHIYHTNAIEGNTLTLTQTRSIVETRLAVGGKSLREQNEVLGLDSALSFINNTLLDRIGRLTLQDLLDIHLRVLGYVDPSEAGRLRTTQVYVGDYIPPAASDLQVHMDQLVEWLNSEEASALHPIEFAALAHYRLVAIHPFYDGNGRTSRLLMNVILMQVGFPPVSIEVGDRLTYYETLEQANNGDIRPFIRFISRCTERTLDEYLSLLKDDYEMSLPSTYKHRKSSVKSRVIYVDAEDNSEDDEDEKDFEEENGQSSYEHNNIRTCESSKAGDKDAVRDSDIGETNCPWQDWLQDSVYLKDIDS